MLRQHASVDKAVRCDVVLAQPDNITAQTANIVRFAWVECIYEVHRRQLWVLRSKTVEIWWDKMLAFRVVLLR